MNHFKFEFEFDGTKHTGEVTVSVGPPIHLHITNVISNPFQLGFPFIAIENVDNGEIQWGMPNPNARSFISHMVTAAIEESKANGIKFPESID